VDSFLQTGKSRRTHRRERRVVVTATAGAAGTAAIVNEIERRDRARPGARKPAPQARLATGAWPAVAAAAGGGKGRLLGDEGASRPATQPPGDIPTVGPEFVPGQLGRRFVVARMGRRPPGAARAGLRTVEAPKNSFARRVKVASSGRPGPAPSPRHGRCGRTHGITYFDLSRLRARPTLAPPASCTRDR